MLTARNLALVGCRIIAIYILWDATLDVFVSSSRIFGSDLSLSWNIVTAFLLLLFFSIAFGFLPFLVLWFGANWISQRITSDISEDSQSANLTASKVLVLLIMAIGVYAMLQAVVGIGLSTFLVIDGESTTSAILGSFTEALLLIGTGVGCIFGAKTITMLLIKAAK